MRAVVHDPVPSNLELQIRLRQQQAVADLGQMALADGLLDELLAEATRIVASELRVEFASLLELTTERDLIVRSLVGWPPEMRDHELLRAELSSQAAYTLGSKDSVILDDVATETRFAVSPQAVAQGITSGISTSVGSNGGVFGVLSAHTRALRTFTEHDVAFLEAVAHILSMSVRRQVAEAEAEKSHRMLEAVIMGTSDSIFVKDLDGRFLVLNDAAASHFGLNGTAVVGRALLDVLPKPQADVMLESDRHVLERGTVEHFEEEVAFDDGTRVFLTTKGPYRGADGTVLGTFGIAKDITDRKRQEQELRAARDYADRLIETSNAIVLVLDTDANILTFNRAAEEITGYRREEVIGRNWEMFVPGARFAEPWQKFDQLITRGSPENYQNPIVTKSGEERMILWQNTQMRDNDGQVVGTISFGIDVTETVAANERAEELETRLRHAEKLEALGQLAGGVAHDFNNLLLAIRGYGESALVHIRADTGEPASDVQAMLGAANRAAELTKQLLAFGRRQVLNPEIVDLNDVVRESVSLLERVIGEDFELVSSTPDAPITVRADRGELVRVITNLTLNARDAMPGGGVIRIRTTLAEGGHPAGSALLTVTDEGMGIDPETALRVFEPFFTTKGDSGTGLGLATVYGIVAQSGGEVTFDTIPGRGTTFRVSLPLDSATGLSLPTAKAVDLETNSCDGKETILLVEDDPAVRTVVSAMLTGYGYEVVATDTGTKAVELSETRDPAFDLVLTDLVMRDLDGRETASRIRDVNPTAKILYMSGYAADSTMRTDPLPSNTAFIQKPFGGNELALQVRRLLDIARSLN